MSENVIKDCVSVGILAYNQAEYIQDTIQSVLDQTYPNIELVIVDDHSTDDTVKNILAMKDTIEQRCVHFELIVNERNTGNMAHNANLLLQHYHGSYVKGLGGDDMLTPDSCARSMEYVRNAMEKPDVVCSDVYIVDGKFHYPRNLMDVASYEIMRNLPLINDNEELLASLLVCNRFICIGALCNVKALREVGGYDEQIRVEDYQMWIRLAMHKKKFSILHEPLAFYRRTGGSVTNFATKDEWAVQKYWWMTEQEIKTIVSFSKAVDRRIILSALIRNLSTCLLGVFCPSKQVIERLDEILRKNPSPVFIGGMLHNLAREIKLFVEKNGRFSVYGYGHNGQLIVDFLDRYKVHYEQVIDARGEDVSDAYHRVCASDAMDVDVDFILVTPDRGHEEISKSLREKGVAQTYYLRNFIDNLLENRYC